MSRVTPPGLRHPWDTLMRTPFPSLADLRRQAANDDEPGAGGEPSRGRRRPVSRGKRPSPAQRRWLRRGLDQPGGKLPLFDERGQRVSRRVVEACLAAGWAEPWFDNPLKPDWLVCRLTDAGREIAAD